MAETILQTERLRLRTWDEADIDPFMRHLNTVPVMRWLGGATDRDRYVALYDRMNRLQAEHGHCFWIVERKEDRALLGFCGLKITNNGNSSFEGTPEIGWRLREDAWGKGYAREAATETLRFAFDDRELERVMAITIPENEASWGLMERLGMTRRPELDFEDPEWSPRYGKEIVYSMDRAQWRA